MTRISALLTGLALMTFALALEVRAEEAATYQTEFQYKEYVVVKGDTLWSISRRELQDSFMWPILWKENLRINNPDLIYPGQVIVIPIRVLVKSTEGKAPEVVSSTIQLPERMPEQMPEGLSPDKIVRTPVSRKVDYSKVLPMITRNALVQAGYITRLLPEAGTLTGSPVYRMTFGNGDEVYLDVKERAEVGKKFFIVRPQNDVPHPVTRLSLGWLIRVVGTVEVEEAGTHQIKGRVTEMFDLIEPGDILDYYYDVVPPFLSGQSRTPQVGGHVVATSYMKYLNANLDLVFVDKGTDSGLLVGDLFLTLMPETDDRPNSLIQLVNVRKETSMGVVLKADYEVSVSHPFTWVREFK